MCRVMSLEFGPPNLVKPARELAGEILLKFGKASEAKEQFEAALARAPGRALSLKGLAEAREASLHK